MRSENVNFSYICEEMNKGMKKMGYKRCRMVYHLENGDMIKDIKEFYYQDTEKMLERVKHHVLDNTSVTAIDSKGTLIPIACHDIVKVELDHLQES